MSQSRYTYRNGSIHDSLDAINNLSSTLAHLTDLLTDDSSISWDAIHDSVNSLRSISVWDDDAARVDAYIGNPRDYVNTVEYERLLQHSMDIDIGSHGTLPASKAAVENLEKIVVGERDGKKALECSICLELVNVGEDGKKALKEDCGHGFHGDCITTWLFSRNSCPLCRSKLPTDNAESK